MVDIDILSPSDRKVLLEYLKALEKAEKQRQVKEQEKAFKDLEEMDI